MHGFITVTLSEGIGPLASRHVSSRVSMLMLMSCLSDYGQDGLNDLKFPKKFHT